MTNQDKQQRGGGKMPRSRDETPSERLQRKARESDNLDEALKETFPSSDPVSPYFQHKPRRD